MKKVPFSCSVYRHQARYIPPPLNVLYLAFLRRSNVISKSTFISVAVLVTSSIVMQIIDLATLTGACIIALGPSIAGFVLLFVSFFFNDYLEIRICVGFKS